MFNLGDIPHSLQELGSLAAMQGALPIRILTFLFACFAWTLWVTRNKMAIEKRYPVAPYLVIDAEMVSNLKRSQQLEGVPGRRIC